MRELLAAIRAREQNKDEEALEHLAKAIGAEGKITPFMRNQLPNLLKDPHDAILTLVIHESISDNIVDEALVDENTTEAEQGEPLTQEEKEALEAFRRPVSG